MYKNTIRTLIALDLLLIILHFLLGNSLQWLNLDAEYNLPTYYQGIKAICLGLYLLRINNLSFLGWMSVYVGLDEVLVIHEKTENFFRIIFPNVTTSIISTAKSYGYQSVTWVLLLSPIFIGVMLYCLKLLTQLPKDQRIILFISMLFFSLAIITEILNTQAGLPFSLYHQSVAFEEGCELLGISNLFRLSHTTKIYRSRT